MNKKSIFGLLAVVMIAAVAALNVSLNSQKEKLSDLAMENVEALASETSEEFTAKTGCIAVWENYKCSGKDGITYSYAKEK